RLHAGPAHAGDPARHPRSVLGGRRIIRRQRVGKARGHSPTHQTPLRPMRPHRRVMGALALLAGAVLPACRSSSAARPASLVVYGRVWTGDSARPWAQAVAASGDSIVAVGDSAVIARLVGPGTRVLASGTGMVTPGFMDGHVHFVDGGFQLASV